MRDYLIIGFVFAMLPFCFFRPYIGVLMWVWISIMNPHRLTWGPAFGFPFAQLVALATLAGLPFAKDRAKIPMEREVWLILLLGAQFTVSTVMSLNPVAAWLQWSQVMKMFLMTLVPLILLQEQNRLRLLLLVMTVSLGFFSVKAGIFSILTRGQHTVFGPDGTFISDNNSLALAELMILPVMVHLARTEPRPWVRRGLLVAVPLTLVSIIFSYSRGALVALVAVLGLHFATRKRWIYGAVFLVVAAGSMAFIPSKWFERMNTIKTYQSDPSAMGRINAWHFAFNVAQERPLTGGGFQVFTKALFLRYAPDPYDAHDAHSIYFEVLGEHGFVGLALFLLLLGSCLRSTGDVRKLARRNPSVGWAEDYATTLRLSLIAYAVGGTFLGMAYFDLYYNMVLAVLLLKVIVRKQLAAETAPPLVVVPQAAAVPA